MEKISWKTDLHRYYGSVNYKIFLKAYFFLPGFRYTFWFRKSSNLRGTFNPLYLFYRLMLRRCSFKYGIDIPCETKIGKGFFINHFSCLIISSDAVIGENVNVSQGVTIGLASRGDNKGVATIGNNVYIGPGAKIVGNVKIGNNVAIGANAVVTKDVVDNSVIVGIPAKVISMKGTRGYVINTV